MKYVRSCIILLAALFCSPATAQWQVPFGAIPFGKGAGVSGFGTVTGSAGNGLRCLTDTTPPSFTTCPPLPLAVGSSVITGGTSKGLLFNNAGVLGNLATINNGVLVTSVAGVPSVSTNLPNGLKVFDTATGSGSIFTIENAGSSSNASTSSNLFLNLPGCAACDTALQTFGGASPSSAIVSASGLTGGLTVGALGGSNLNLITQSTGQITGDAATYSFNINGGASLNNMYFHNTFDGGSLNFRFFGKNSAGNQVIGAIQNCGLASNVAGSEIGDCDFLIYNAGNLFSPAFCAAMEGTVGTAGFNPCNDGVFNLGKPGGRWGGVYGAAGHFNTMAIPGLSVAGVVTNDASGNLSTVTALPLNLGGTAGTTASAARTNLGVTATGADTAYNFRANNLSDVASVATARTNLGVTATGADATYNVRASNLSDVASAATARTNLGVTATGADTAYNFRANNLSDVANASTARTNLGLVAIAASGSATDLSAGTVPAARMPALTGGCTSTVGTVALSCTSNIVLSFSSSPFAGLTGGSTIFAGTAGANATEALVSSPVPVAMTIDKLYASYNTAPVGAQTYIATMRKNGVDTTLTCTVTGAATSCNDTTHSFTVIAGDLVDAKIVASATAATSTGQNFMVRGVTTSP